MLHKLKANGLLLPFILLSLVISGCGGGGDKTTPSTPPPEPPAPTTYTITGYAEDDPLVNATITINKENGEKLLDVTTDANGMYTLSAAVEKDQNYIIEAVGELSGIAVSMHSQFVFDGSDSQININPLTELKYQLVQNNERTLAQAEVLVRDYFNTVKGESLETIRFTTTDKSYIGLKDIAEIYNASLPIEAIEKVKEDIVRNDLSSTNQVKDYSYKNLVEQNIKLNVSATSLALGEELTVSIQGIETLNENYTLVWSGLPEEGVTSTNISKTFTTSEYAQDLYISVALYKKIGEQKTYVASASESINFYKPLEEISALVEDSSIDNDYAISDALQMKVPANTLADGVEIKVTELQTNSEKTLAQFAIDSNAASTGTVMVEYNYDPYQVSEPRNLQVTLQGDEPKVINISEIDYVNHVVMFEVPLNAGNSRAANANILYITQSKKIPTKDDVKNLLVKLRSDYKDEFYKILTKFYPNTKDYIFNLLTEFESNPIQLSKIYKVLLEKQKGEYKYNILISNINSKIASSRAEDFFKNNSNNHTWFAARESFNLYMESGCFQMLKDPSGNFVEARLDYPFLSVENQRICETHKSVFANKVLALDNLISIFIGKSKLTIDQTHYYKNLKLIYNISEATASLAVGGTPDTKAKFLDLLGKITGAAIDYSWPEGMGDSENVGNTFAVVNSAAVSIIDDSGDFNVKSQIKGIGQMLFVNEFFKYLEKLTINNNIVKTSPILLALSNEHSKLNIDTNFDALPYIKSDFFQEFFNDYYITDIEQLKENCQNSHLPSCERLEILSVYTYMWEDNDYFSDDKTWQFGALVDANHRLSNLFLGELSITKKERALTYFFLKYAFGDEQARNQINNYANGMDNLGWMILSQMIFMADSEVVSPLLDVTVKDSKKSKIKSEYTIEVSNFDKWMHFIFGKNLSENTNKEILSEVKNVKLFQALMQKSILKLTNSQLSTIHIKEIKVETYGVGLEFSTTDNTWVFDEADKAIYTFKSIDNINQQFVFNSESNKNELSFATLFEGEDFAQFDNKLVGFKVLLTYEKSGVDEDATADFVFTTLADNENLTETDFSGATLKSSVKDAVTGDALAGAFVTLNPGGLSSFTDENGDYEVSSLAAGNYTIIITKAGYKQVEASLTLTEDETKIYEVSLSIDNESATTSGTTNVTIKDAYNGAVLTNGYISLREGQNNKSGTVTQTINSDGDSNIEVTLFPGHYTIEAGANGYAKSYSTVTIVGDVNVNKEVSISPVLADDQLRAVLTWGQFPSDLDSHLVKKINGVESYHVYYENQVLANADASLDIDDTSSYGPETVTINNIDPNAIYTYYVYNFSGGEDSVLPDSGAKIDIYSGDSSQTLFIPNEGGQYWKVFEIVNGEIVPCTENCVRATDEGIARSINSEALIFKGLPPK
jgi:hypothetical protein